MFKRPGISSRHKRKRSASPSLGPSPLNDGDRWTKRLRTNKRARSASPSLPHRSPTNSNRLAKKSKRTHHSDDVIPVLMGGEASASMRDNGPSPVPSSAPVDSRSTEKQDQQAQRTVNHRPTRSPSPSPPHRPPVDSDISTRKLKTTHKSGDTIIIPVRTGEEEEEERGVSRHHDMAPSLLPPVDSISTERNQQAHTAGILPTPTTTTSLKRNTEVILNLPHKPKPKPTLEMPAAKKWFSLSQAQKRLEIDLCWVELFE